ncbi:MAG: DNA primase [Campylobacterota bacterium]|nr:DNA primase [Campylobacterota bacterium]
MIAADSIEGLKARLDIVDVIGGYIELRKAGANHKGNCPFHDEKTPSFVVSPQKQIYHCFGCGAGGDSIKFVMEHDKLSYPEAIEKLADSCNYTLSYTKGTQKKTDTKIIESLNGWYQTLLEKNITAKSYLVERGIYASSIERFGIGYAPSSNDTLNYLKSNMYNMTEAIELGVVGSGENNIYARFIERITFPIYAANGTAVGFGGRTISGHSAKYVNSPQTKLFNKSRLLYAYDVAKDAIYKKSEMIVTEGYLDVIMLHQAGFNNAVATLGTALTPEHLPLLRKGDPRIIMAYDGDNAGIAAALKAAKLLSAAGFDGGVVIFAEGVDPADMVKNGKIEELNTLFRSAKPFIEFVLDLGIGQYDLSNPKEKEKAMHEGVGYLKTLSPLLQEEYKNYFSSRLGLSPSLIKISAQTQNSSTTAPVSNYGDAWERSLIKTAVENPQYINQIVDSFSSSLLQHHANELELVLRGQLDDPRVMAIVIDDKNPSFKDTQHLNDNLIFFLRNHYEKALKQVKFQQELPLDKKSFLIRSYRNKIAKLKRGELVPYEG